MIEVLRFVDSLLRCGVATLFALDAWRRTTQLLEPARAIPAKYAELWSTKGVPAEIAELVPWALVALGACGAVLVMWPRLAGIGALVLVAAAGLELASVWGHPWEPQKNLGFTLGAALVAVSQALLRRAASARRSEPAAFRL